MIATRAPARTVIVGDVHGCAAELEDLLDQVGFSVGTDRLVCVGDLVVRGPDPRGTLALVRRVGGRSVRGNHEERLLAWRLRGRPLGPDHARVADELSDPEWAMLEAMPLWLDLPEHGVRVVHAGQVPGREPAATEPEALLKVRTIDRRGRWSDEPEAGPLWGARYRGPPHVVFGHHARPEPQLHEWATGLDTGCVYGGRLTAAVLGGGEPMPHGAEAARVLRSTPARRRYFGGKGGPLAP